MQIDNLVHMANRIGQFFDAMPDRAEALEGIARHLRLYWEPGMRTAIVAHARQPDTALLPLVSEAIRQHAPLLLEVKKPGT